MNNNYDKLEVTKSEKIKFLIFIIFVAIIGVGIFYISFIKADRNNKNEESSIVLPVGGNIIDSDGDGLTDVEEEKYNTDKFSSDTDNDGYTDFNEIMSGYNPLGEGKLILEKKNEDMMQESFDYVVEKNKTEKRQNNRSNTLFSIFKIFFSFYGIIILFIVLIVWFIFILISSGILYFVANKLFNIYEASFEKSFQIIFIEAIIVSAFSILSKIITILLPFNFLSLILSFINLFLGVVVLCLLLKKFYKLTVSRIIGVVITVLIIQLILGCIILFIFKYMFLFIVFSLGAL